jgi:hypothetical protein
VSKKKVVKIVKNKPLPKARLIDLSNLPDLKHEEVVRHANHALATIMKDGHCAGYAMVCWDMNGAIGTSMWAARGSIGRGMIPAVVHDALLKRIAAVEAMEEINGEGKTAV